VLVSDKIDYNGLAHQAGMQNSSSSSYTPRRSLVPLATRRKWFSLDVAMVHCQCRLLYNYLIINTPSSLPEAREIFVRLKPRLAHAQLVLQLGNP